MSKLSDEIIFSLNNQPSWIIHDVQTFQWLRFNNHEIFEKEKLGGGNILSIIGLISALNYYAKVYKVLQSRKLPRENQEESDKNVFVEDQAFKRLAIDFNERIVGPNQNDEVLGKVWKIFRNALSHMAQIYEGNQALVLFNDSNLSSEELKKSIKLSQDTPFIQVEGGFICFVDKFISYMENVREWIIKDMDSRFPEENIIIANNWIKEKTRL